MSLLLSLMVALFMGLGPTTETITDELNPFGSGQAADNLDDTVGILDDLHDDDTSANPD